MVVLAPFTNWLLLAGAALLFVQVLVLSQIQTQMNIALAARLFCIDDVAQNEWFELAPGDAGVEGLT